MGKLNSRSITLIFLLFPGISSGQILPFHSYGVEQGLVSDALTSLCEDSRGYLWIGTGDGVSVFDGAVFRNIRATDGLSLNHVTHVTESHCRPGEMLIGTWGGGISRLREGKFTTLSSDSSSRAKTIRDVEEDQQGTVWCIADSGVYKSDGGSFALLPNTLAATDLFVTRDSAVWIALGSKIAIFAAGSGVVLDEIGLPGKEEVTTMFEDLAGSIWIGTSDSLLIQIHERKVAGYRRVPHGVIKGIHDDARGTVWLATTNGILGIERASAFSSPFMRYSEENGLRSNAAVTCLVDFEDNLWVGLLDAGLTRLSERNVFSFSLPGIVDSYNNSRAVTDERGHIWTIIDWAIVEVWKDPTGNWRSHQNPIPNVTGISIPTIDRDMLGRLWVDTRRRIECYEVEPTSGGASRLHLKSFVEPGRSLPSGPRFFFVIDRKLNLWVSVVGEGVYRVSTIGGSGKTEHYSVSNGLPSNDIRVIFEDSAHSIWLGGVEGGIAVITNGGNEVTRRISADDGLPDELIRAIDEDNRGRMWIGTRRKGLEIGENGKFSRVSIEEGLLGSAVWAIAADTMNDLIWAGTSQGVEKIGMTTKTPVRSNSLLIGKPVTSLGIYAGKFLWFVTKDALTVFEFPSGKIHPPPPRTHITQILVNARPIDMISASEFRHDENLFTFEYAGLTFRETEAVRYQSRLLGAEEEWQAESPQRTVTYASLSPGVYTYEVRTINAEGVLNESPASFTFTIVAPFWSTWWFTAFGVIVIVCATVFVVRLRIHRLLEIERLRSRIARDLHDEIGSNLSSIALASDLLLRNSGMGDQEQRKLSQISAIALGTVQNMKDIVWLIHPGNDTLDNLLLRMKDVAGSLLDGCSYTMNFPPTTDKRKVTLEWKRNVYLIFKESLTNILKHAHATSVIIDVEVRNGRLAFTITDDGVGFNPQEPTGGNGLKNLRERAQLLNGALEIRPEAGKGTIVRLEVEIT